MRVLVDGREVSADASAPIGTLGGERHAGGVFTTARVAAGAIVRADAHRERLVRESGDAERAERTWKEAVACAREAEDAMVRVVLAERRVVAVAPARRPAWRPGDPGLVLAVGDDPRGPAPFRKEVRRERLAAVEAQARAGGADGALLIGPEGVREGTWFHVLARVDGVWRTPEAALPGTTLPAVPLPVTRGPLVWEELERSDRVLACSSLLGVAPVERVGERSFRWRNEEIPRVPM